MFHRAHMLRRARWLRTVAGRVRLVVIAQERAGQALGQTFDRASTVLIGDTPQDVEAGREGGAHVIAVASGKSSMVDLKAAGADVVLPDLMDMAALSH